MSDLDDLLAEATKEAKASGTYKPPPKERQRYPYSQTRKEPEALVLVIHRVHCHNCGKEHDCPNSTIQTRFGTLSLGFEGPLSLLQGTPHKVRLLREVVIYHSHCAFCHECFEADEVQDLNIWPDKRWGNDKINPAYLRDDDRLLPSETEEEGDDEEDEKSV